MQLEYKMFFAQKITSKTG